MRRLILAAAILLCSVPANASDLTALKGQSGDVAAASAVATLTGVATKRTYLSKVIIAANGATAGTCVAVAITGADVGTINFDYCVPAGATVPAPFAVIDFSDDTHAGVIFNSTGGNIVVTVPSLGAGNLHASVTALGYAR